MIYFDVEPEVTQDNQRYNYKQCLALSGGRRVVSIVSKAVYISVAAGGVKSCIGMNELN